MRERLGWAPEPWPPAGPRLREPSALAPSRARVCMRTGVAACAGIAACAGVDARAGIGVFADVGVPADVRARAGASLTRVKGADAAALAGAAGGGALSGRMAEKSASARCSFGVMTLSAPRASCFTTRASKTIMIAPTMARRPLTARSSTAERESPRSVTSIGGPPGLENASIASRTALCSSGPMELSLSHSTSPCSSCKDTA